MINFYSEWAKFKGEGISESSFIEEFLGKSNLSIQALANSNVDDAKEAFAFILNLDISKFVNKFKYQEGLDSTDVPQFSSLDAALISIPLALENLKEYVSFKEVGRMLIDTKEDLARMKYGENHSKVCADCSFVQIDKINNKSRVKITNFGKASTFFSKEDVYKVAAAMLCRNKLIQNLIFKAKTGKVSFKDEVPFLSDSTLGRRKSNVKAIVELVLSHSGNFDLMKNIEW
mgnify:CR=1 FL=1